MAEPCDAMCVIEFLERPWVMGPMRTAEDVPLRNRTSSSFESVYSHGMIPTRHIYRAFRELDAIPDDQCRRFVRRVRLQQGWSVLVSCVVIGVVSGVGAGTWIGLVLHAWFKGGYEADVAMSLAVLMGGPSGVLAGCLAGLLLRDVQLWWGLRRELRRTCCPKCGYSLLGLPVRRVAFGVAQPGDAKVRCSECGLEIVLTDRGLAPHDLVPWEQRGVPEDFAKVRRSRG